MFCRTYFDNVYLFCGLGYENVYYTRHSYILVYALGRYRPIEANSTYCKKLYFDKNNDISKKKRNL